MRLNERDKLALYSNLNTTLDAGIPISEAVNMLLQESTGNTKLFLQTLHARLNEGGTISDAMQKTAGSFNQVSINMMRAAEEAGTLEETLLDLEKNTRQQIAFNDELRASLMYPVFVFVVFLGVLLLMLLFVVPRISKVILGLRTPIPPTTQFVFNTSTFLINNYVGVIAVIVALVVLGVVVYKTRRKQVINILYRLPVIHTLGKNLDLLRFCRSMSLMLRAGIPISEALKYSKSVVNLREISKLIDKMIANVELGHVLSEGLDEKNKIVPQLMIRLTKTAEYSGSLEASMQKLADYFQTQVSKTLKTLSALIEPVLIIVVGLMTGGLMLTIIAPIYGLISNIRAR